MTQDVFAQALVLLEKIKRLDTEIERMNYYVVSARENAKSMMVKLGRRAACSPHRFVGEGEEDYSVDITDALDMPALISAVIERKQDTLKQLRAEFEALK